MMINLLVFFFVNHSTYVYLSYFLAVKHVQVHNTFLDQVSLLNRPFRPLYFPRCCSKFVQLPRFASLTLILLKSFCIRFHFGFHFGFGSTLASQRLSLALEMVFPHLSPCYPPRVMTFAAFLSLFFFIYLSRFAQRVRQPLAKPRKGFGNSFVAFADNMPQNWPLAN